MADEIAELVARLPELKNVTEVWESTDQRLARGDAAFLADLGIALTARYGPEADQVWQYRSVFDRLVRSLTLSDPEHVVHALRLVSAPQARGAELDRFAASLLASGHRAEDLAVAFTTDGVPGGVSEELRTCLVHELALRGAAVTETPGIAAWAASPHFRHHPLGWLPPTLSPVEGRPDLPSYHLTGGGHAMPYGPAEHPGPLPASGEPVPAMSETTTPEVASALTRAVENWVAHSNGRVEAREFAPAEPLDPASVHDALEALGLECLEGVGERGPLAVVTRPPERVWAVLFAAASTGGAYDSGLRGAYGRLAAWRSLAGLAGAEEGASAEEVEARARDCHWYEFGADVPWFEFVAWDIGLVSVAGDGRRLAVLAATDTD